MITAFISLRFLDLVDILIVAFLLYQVYLLIKGSPAINIFSGIFILYLLWLVVRALNMELLGSILGQVIGVGVLAIIILFQQEIRKFLIVIGTQYIKRNKLSVNRFLILLRQKSGTTTVGDFDASPIVNACINMSSSNTGALIAITRNSDLSMYGINGVELDAKLTPAILESIFFKNSPLHDGAVFITGNKVQAARCVLPISSKLNLPDQYGMRHRAALGLSEETDAVIVIVSEETGKISIVENGNVIYDISSAELMHTLNKIMN